MKLIIQLVFLCVLFYLCLRYDLGVAQTKSISRSILFTLLIGVIYLITMNSTREGAVMGNSSNYFGTSKTDEMSESEEESDEDTTGDVRSGDDKKKKKNKKKKKKKKKK